MLNQEAFAWIKWEGKGYPVDVKHNERFKKFNFGSVSGKQIRLTLALIGSGLRTTVRTIDYIDDDDNTHGHDVSGLLYVSYKDIKDGKDEVRVFAASDDFMWCSEVGKATVTINPLKINKGQWGGKREGAGRRPVDTKSVVVRLTPDQHKKFKQLGGSQWLQGVIDKE